MALGLLLWMVLAQGQVTIAASDELAAARALYASGEYEEALTRFSEAKNDRTADEVDQYRALCLLALGRTAETEKSLQELIARRPLFTMSEADVSPRLVTLFHSVRRRVLPGIIRELYTTAKASFEQKQYAMAATQLVDLLDLLDDEDMAQESAAFTDLRMLGEGFLKLAESEIAAAEKAEAAAAAAARAAALTAKVEPPTASIVIYSDADQDVTAPLAISQTIPPWRAPSNAALAARTYRGHLQVVINEQGLVQTAELASPISEGYDSLLLAAARQWRFRPATKDGRPVKYQKVFSIELLPR